ncbi:SGNH hydrolase-type esterase domain-containing protein [Astrocystis sublimbata]|nr:SGNH hydrolase-type esterase domain-containing protein [Astrocystis sublimbata]
MFVFSKSLVTALVAFLAVLPNNLASPLYHKTAEIARLLGRDAFEWTALGDSYASGVGAGDYASNSYRCLRYDHAYPVLISGDSRLTKGDYYQLNNVVCSGSSTEDVQKYQFYDKDTYGQPDWQFGNRPKFGNPSMATLSIGGNDIDFPGIIFNCILELNLPFNAGPLQRTCDEQRMVSWELIKSPNLVENIDNTIKKVVEKGRKGTIGNRFKLYVTGFPQFFNADTEECNEVTFARTANPFHDGAEHTKLTQELRTEFNSMSVQLNKAIEDAVSRNEDRGVRWISIDGEMEGHRYCEKGIHEPDQHNNDLWLFHYPYNEPDIAGIEGPLLKAYEKVTASVDIKTSFKTYNDYQNAVFDAIENAMGIQDGIWSSVGHRVKTFHPRAPLHERIRDLVLEKYMDDLALPPPLTFDEKPECYGINGDYWKDKTVKYNINSVNELKLSARFLAARNLSDNIKDPTDAPSCIDRFRDAVIDGCDGDGLGEKPAQLQRSTSYKFLFDSFESRGNNFVPAKFGANGEGLKRQLKGCGALIKWKFEETPDDARFQW